jgi:hypothetical protein
MDDKKKLAISDTIHSRHHSKHIHVTNINRKRRCGAFCSYFFAYLNSQQWTTTKSACFNFTQTTNTIPMVTFGITQFIVIETYGALFRHISLVPTLFAFMSFGLMMTMMTTSAFGSCSSCFSSTSGFCVIFSPGENIAGFQFSHGGICNRINRM